MLNMHKSFCNDSFDKRKQRDYNRHIVREMLPTAGKQGFIVRVKLSGTVTCYEPEHNDKLGGKESGGNDFG